MQILCIISLAGGASPPRGPLSLACPGPFRLCNFWAQPGL